ncbi:MAG: thioredoxin family protein [Candidatus Lokiarchaeota archaeon]|nr:thioredoxin family protein [Candidatus Lokiarchaeota archaeon]
MILEILLFISPSCGFCPLVEQRLLGIIEKNKLPIKIKKIDITKTPEISETYNVVVLPTLVFNGFIKVYGVFEQDLLEDLVVNYYVKSLEFQQEPFSGIPAQN